MVSTRVIIYVLSAVCLINFVKCQNTQNSISFNCESIQDTTKNCKTELERILNNAQSNRPFTVTEFTFTTISASYNGSCDVVKEAAGNAQSCTLALCDLHCQPFKA